MFGSPRRAAFQSGPESDHAKLGKERARHHVPEQRRRAPRRRESAQAARDQSTRARLLSSSAAEKIPPLRNPSPAVAAARRNKKEEGTCGRQGDTRQQQVPQLNPALLSPAPVLPPTPTTTRGGDGERYQPRRAERDGDGKPWLWLPLH